MAATELERVRDMIRTYSQMHRKNKYSQYSSSIQPVRLNGWEFFSKLVDVGLNLFVVF